MMDQPTKTNPLIQEDSERFCNYDEIPLFLGAKDIAKLLGIALTNAYYILRADDFPTIVIGKRRVVRKEKLFKWIAAHEKSSEK